MAVYVDDMQMSARVGRISGEWSHLMADTLDELVEFAGRIGMRRAWLQRKPSGVHFDVTEPRRQQALRLGAVPIECGSDEWMRVVEAARQQYEGPGKRAPRVCRIPACGCDGRWHA
jgi:hypothetical protein